MNSKRISETVRVPPFRFIRRGHDLINEVFINNLIALFWHDNYPINYEISRTDQIVTALVMDDSSISIFDTEDGFADGGRNSDEVASSPINY